MSAEKAVEEIINWVERGSDLENEADDDILELNGDDTTAAATTTDDGTNNDVEEENYDDDDDEEEEEQQQQSRPFYQKVHTYMRDVNSIDSSLDETNYDVFEVPDVEKTLHGNVYDANDKRKRVDITFMNKKPFIPGRQRVAGVMQKKPGISRHARNVKTPVETFKFFFTDDLFQKITELTNIRIEETLVKSNITDSSRNKYSWLKVCTVIEMKAFIGLM